MEEDISFEDLGLDAETLAAVEKKGFKVPSPIQVLAIPRLLTGDTNLIAKARTGTGKTAAFGLPIVQSLRTGNHDRVRALVLEPTRELAMQTCTELASFGDGNYPRVTVLYGGASYSTQIKDLKRGCDIVVGTPGRIKDHLERGTLKLDQIDYFILDEGDEMLDMGFVDDIEEIFGKANPASRILLFSATMPPAILKIAQKFMGEYDIVEEQGFVEEPLLIDQSYWVLRESDKIEALVRLIDISPDFYGLVFTMTKNDADLVSRLLDERGYEAAALHGDIPQAQREKILARFRSRKTRVLVATDVAARGIDISGLTHVVNYSLPFDAATYVHRIGRTGRAGTSGIAITFVRPEESRRKLGFLQNAIRRAAKGEMKEGEVPSIPAVLEVKRARMLDNLKISLGLEAPAVELETESTEALASQSFDSEEVIPLEEGAVESDTEAAEATQAADGTPVDPETEAAEATEASQAVDTVSQADAFIPTLKEVDPLYTQMAQDLCQNQDPQEVLAGVLSVWYGKSLDESRYGKIAGTGRASSGPKANQKRIYIQLGRRDGYNPRALAEYFSDLLHIPGRLVDRIEMTQNFSLVSLPIASADKVLEMAKRDSSIPHIHLDSKEGGDGKKGGRSFGGRRGPRSFDRSSDEGFGRKRFDRGGRFGDRDRFGKDGKKGFKNEHGRSRPHTPTQRTGASAYKKVNRKSDEY